LPVVVAGAVPSGLLPHSPGGGGAAGDTVDSAREVQRFLDGPDLLVLARREDAGRITDGDPANGHRLARRHDRIDLNHSMNPHLSARAHDTAREQGSAGSQQAPIAHPRPFRCAWGPTKTSSPMIAECLARPPASALAAT
jgi:hypothetical protein